MLLLSLNPPNNKPLIEKRYVSNLHDSHFNPKHDSMMMVAVVSWYNQFFSFLFFFWRKKILQWQEQQQSGHINIKKKLSVKFEFIFLMHYLEKISTTFYEIEFKTKKKIISHLSWYIYQSWSWNVHSVWFRSYGWWLVVSNKKKKNK